MVQIEAVLEPFHAAASISAEDGGALKTSAFTVTPAEIGGPMRASASQECRTLPARQDAPTEKDAAAAEPEPKPEPEPSPENQVKRQGGKGKPRPSQVGNTRGHDAAVFKRQVRDRLEALRKKGVSAPELVKAAPAGSVKESDIYMILQGHVIKIDIYRALDEALRHFEN